MAEVASEEPAESGDEEETTDPGSGSGSGSGRDSEKDSEKGPDKGKGKGEGGEKKPDLWNALLKGVLMWPLSILAEIGTMARLAFETVMWAVRPPYRFYLLIDAMEFIGVQSIFIVGLTGTFVGGVFGLQLVDGFRQFGAEDRVGAVVGIALTRELAPVFSALMISSRAGSAIATEIASMRVTNQIDALTTMSVNPVQFLITPRILAGTLTTPIMALVFNLVGITGAYFVAVKLLGLDGGIFIDRVKWFVDAKDVAQGLIKAAFFGATLTLIACRQGFYAKGGAAGVGRATNRAVVQSAVAILILDYILTSIIIGEGF